MLPLFRLLLQLQYKLKEGTIDKKIIYGNLR